MKPSNSIKKRSRKKRWVDFEITRVKLNPEQAVLACCDSVAKGYLNMTLLWQCQPTWPDPVACGQDWRSTGVFQSS